MYRPKFCAECSVKIIRLRWHFWTSRRFCDSCAPRFLTVQVKRLISVTATVFLIGMVAGQAAHRTPPPVVIQRTQNSISPLTAGEGNRAPVAESNTGPDAPANISPRISSTEELYICGARTKKGSPCTRKVHGPVRCWQHLGLPAMLQPERLRINSQ